MDQMPLPERTWRWRWGIAFFVLILLCRAGVAAALHRLTGGRALTDDQGFMSAFLDHPWQILLAKDQGGPQFWPPLFPLVIAPFGWFYRLFFDDFLAIRGISITFELFAWPAMWVAVCRNILDRRSRLLIGGLYVVLPLAIGTSSAMAQDETVSMFALTLVMLLLYRRQYSTAAFVCGLAAAACKIYFVVPLTVVVFAPYVDGGRFWGVIRRGLLGLAGLLPFYLITFYNQHQAALALAATRPELAGGVALGSFSPDGSQGVSFWTLVQLYRKFDPVSLKYVSGLMAMASVGLLILGVWVRRINPTPRQMMAVTGAALLGVLLWFIHCDSEYYMMALPFLLAVLRPRWIVAIVGVGLAFVWVANLAYGVKFAETVALTEGGKAVFVRLYHQYIPIRPALLHMIALGVVIVSNLAATALLWRVSLSRGSVEAGR